MVVFNFWCFYKSRKFLNNAEAEGTEGEENYQKGLKYIKISVFVSLLICLTGATAVIVIKFI